MATRTKRKPRSPARSDANSVGAWCREGGIGKTKFYALEIRPRTIKLGHRTIVLESPREYFERVAAAQKAA